MRLWQTSRHKESFDSLRAGKCLQSDLHIGEGFNDDMFRFPLSGKVSPKQVLKDKNGSGGFTFRFPSSGKVSLKGLTPVRINATNSKMFPFPSDGKAFANVTVKLQEQVIGFEFPFPCNGKALSDIDLVKIYADGSHEGFHSLQMGKHLWTVRHA